jgi:hypothetical protein
MFERRGNVCVVFTQRLTVDGQDSTKGRDRFVKLTVRLLARCVRS